MFEICTTRFVTRTLLIIFMLRIFTLLIFMMLPFHCGPGRALLFYRELCLALESAELLTLVNFPPEAARITANEQHMPLGFTPPENQVQFIPLINAAISLMNTEEENEANTEKRTGAMAAHETALYNPWAAPHNCTYQNTLTQCAKDLADVSQRFSQEPLTPKKIEAKIDPSLEVVSFKNTSDRCGEVAADLGATDGLTFMIVTTAIANYPMVVECMRKEDARKSYKELNKSALLIFMSLIFTLLIFMMPPFHRGPRLSLESVEIPTLVNFWIPIPKTTKKGETSELVELFVNLNSESKWQQWMGPGASLYVVRNDNVMLEQILSREDALQAAADASATGTCLYKVG